MLINSIYLTGHNTMCVGQVAQLYWCYDVFLAIFWLFWIFSNIFFFTNNLRLFSHGVLIVFWQTFTKFTMCGCWTVFCFVSLWCLSDLCLPLTFPRPVSQIPIIVKALHKQLKEKSVKTRQCCFNMLTELVNVLPGALTQHIPILIPGNCTLTTDLMIWKQINSTRR